MVDESAIEPETDGDGMRVFNRGDRITEGWYWALRSRSLRRGHLKSVSLIGRDLVIYRGQDGDVRAADAYCPHMGCHLGIGRVEGNSLRCFFHGWRFDETGQCDDIPAIKNGNFIGPRIRHWSVTERHGLIWVWIGDLPPDHDVPDPPMLNGQVLSTRIAGRFTKGCHPNVVQVNAIDEHHFQTVHGLPGEVLEFETTKVSRHHLCVRNTGSVPNTTWYWRLLGYFYPDKALYYEVNYFYGSCGTVSLGPTWLRLNLMFATRPTDDGQTEGITIALTRRRRGVWGRLTCQAILVLSAVAGRYFAHGDTKVFNNIRFRLRHPIQPDKTVLAYIRHVEQQAFVRGWQQTAGDVNRDMIKLLAE